MPIPHRKVYTHRQSKGVRERERQMYKGKIMATKVIVSLIFIRLRARHSSLSYIWRGNTIYRIIVLEYIGKRDCAATEGTIAFTLHSTPTLALFLSIISVFRLCFRLCSIVFFFFSFLILARSFASALLTREIAILSHDKLAAHTRNRFDFSTQ